MREGKVVGRSAYSIVESEAGCLYSVAIGVSELEGSLEWAIAEFEYEQSDEAKELVTLCRALTDHLDRVSITEDGTLTLNRICARCGGDGETRGEDPCAECGGSGFIHADEADG